MFRKMILITKVNGYKINGKEKEKWYIRMEINIREILCKINMMEKEDLFGVMAIIMREILKIQNVMVLEKYLINMDKFINKADFLKINFKIDYIIMKI